MTASLTALTAFANTTNLTDQQYIGLVKGGSAAMVCKLLRAWFTGQEASNSRPTIMALAYDSTVGATATGGNQTDNPKHGANSIAPGTLAIVGNGFTTKPQRGANYVDLHGGNAYGGGWKYEPDERDAPIIVGQGVNAGEISYSALTITGGTAAVAGGMEYEIF